MPPKFFRAGIISITSNVKAVVQPRMMLQLIQRNPEAWSQGRSSGTHLLSMALVRGYAGYLAR